MSRINLSTISLATTIIWLMRTETLIRRKQIHISHFQLKQQLKTISSDPTPCLGELQATIRSWILGMGPLDLEKTKSICFLGPPGCGKKHIIYAVVAELDAIVFDLSTEAINKYKDDMPYLMHLVSKMAKILQPAVLFINGAHKPFIKKVLFYLEYSRIE